MTEKSIAEMFDSKPKVSEPTWLPEPEPRERKHLIISVDDHVVEAPDMFEGRMPAHLADRAPKVIELDNGDQLWEFNGKRFPNIGLNAVAGRPPTEFTAEPERFDHMRRGCWDVEARVHDMDLNGVYASLNFPSMLAGFAGQRFSQIDDQELGLATLRAWNDWIIEDWYKPHPGRIIPAQLAWLTDPVMAAEEIRRNAERGFRAVTFSENPSKLGLPSVHNRSWDPFWQACEETETAVCLHVGSSSSTPSTSDDAPPDVAAILFPMSAWFAGTDWVYSKIPIRFPDIKIVLSEGGISWLPGLIDRMDHSMQYAEFFGTWAGETLSPSELLRRNFYFCAIDDPSGFRERDFIGIDHIMFEVDYPHADGTWPDTQYVVEKMVSQANMSAAEAAKVTALNAAKLFRHPLPHEVGLESEWPVATLTHA
jgi:predicted TIM-barrel fold metal-dependent hydrolase